MYTILLVIHTIIVVFLILMVLLQRTDSDGLSGLSGGGGNQFLTGRGAANLMTRTTSILAAAFMITSLILAVMASRMTGGSIIDRVGDTAVPVEAPANAADTKTEAPKADEAPAAKAPDVKAKEAPKAAREKTDNKAKPEPAAPAVPKPE